MGVDKNLLLEYNCRESRNYKMQKAVKIFLSLTAFIFGTVILYCTLTDYRTMEPCNLSMILGGMPLFASVIFLYSYVFSSCNKIYSKRDFSFKLYDTVIIILLCVFFLTADIICFFKVGKTSSTDYLVKACSIKEQNFETCMYINPTYKETRSSESFVYDYRIIDEDKRKLQTSGEVSSIDNLLDKIDKMKISDAFYIDDDVIIYDKENSVNKTYAKGNRISRQDLINILEQITSLK